MVRNSQSPSHIMHLPKASTFVVQRSVPGPLSGSMEHSPCSVIIICVYIFAVSIQVHVSVWSIWGWIIRVLLVHDCMFSCYLPVFFSMHIHAMCACDGFMTQIFLDTFFGWIRGVTVSLLTLPCVIARSEVETMVWTSFPPIRARSVACRETETGD